MTEENSIFKGFKHCECSPDCTEIIPIIGDKKVFRQFKSGHQNRGKNHGMYKQGESKDKGYFRVYSPDHPFKDKKNRVYKHRLIYENYLSIILDEEIYISRDWDVHHIKPVNEGGTNNIENLQLITRAEHMRIHKKGIKNGKQVDTTNRYCLLCGGKTWINKKTGYEDWHKYQDGFICNKCYCEERRKVKYKFI